MARILIIDDARDIRVALRKLLERVGYEVLEAANGMEASRLYNASPVDLVITDILMPEKDGVEILLELRKAHPGIKAIVISGEGQEFLPVAEDFGALRTFSKPFEPGEVLRTVKELVGE